ncbi:sugar ABC transporter ATP-binding protein [Vibrio europaeus]|uniref:sugar ABC transporter ATP-binding protein n=1 Tax=Vibrio europaeus TaxID=300876 RepID=UPI0018A72AA0|nr:sugar ABC transporter ATP-binding protein [Vibrio europaeus]MDC5812768.1 sugar ABC transporter ATP-binding protein [Vibrio europaeus]QPG37562.1 sugar ABC transporter ATP-binding protein [Vibrio europaeus]
MNTHNSTSVLSIEGLVKDYPGVRAVNNVSFSIERSTVHCLIGENGAGKSTLVKMITGAIQPTQGTMKVNGKSYTPNGTQSAREAGIATLFQELHVVDELSVLENLTLGMEQSRFGFLIKSDLEQRVIDTLATIEPSIDPYARVSTLGVAQKQIIEIARAASSGANVIIMDEPTAALSEREVERLFTVIRRLQEQQVTVIYISHKLDEILSLGDKVTVMRDGQHIATKPMADVNGREELIDMMIGRSILHDYTPRDTISDEVFLSAERLNNHRLKNVSFTINKGEIVGFYGLVGAGKTEIARAIFGADKVSGSIKLNGQEVGKSPREAIAAGIALVPEERRTQGLFTNLTIRENIPVMNLPRMSDFGVFRQRDELNAALDYVDKLSIATSSIEKHTEKLSGGNQQKVVIAKCLFSQAKLLLLDEPTRGVDVGAKKEIYDLVKELANQGNSVAVFSTELEEILGVCDRIFLLYDGSLVSEITNGSDVDTNFILNAATGGLQEAV